MSSSSNISQAYTGSSGRTEDDAEYPPCVVVVERGRNGKPDTYYVIPGGAPVIFEDQHGKELTRSVKNNNTITTCETGTDWGPYRVGDFTGRYHPKKQRPVIIEDEHGREVGR